MMIKQRFSWKRKLFVIVLMVSLVTVVLLFHPADWFKYVSNTTYQPEYQVVATIKHNEVLPFRKSSNTAIKKTDSRVKKKIKKKIKKTNLDLNHRCPDVLRMMTVGKWVPKKTSKKELEAMKEFLRDVREERGIPENLSRSDGRCNVNLQIRSARALCDPNGSRPCCHHNKCKALPVEKCRCEDCYDVRQRINAEHATWTPEDERCKMKNFTASEACGLLSGSYLYLIGDSHMRHLHSAFMMVTKNDGIMGGLRKGVNRDCGGSYTFGSKSCRSGVDAHAKPASLCNGTFKLSFISHARSNYAPAFLQLVKQNLNKEKVVLMPGQGTWDNCNSTKTKQYLKDGINLLKSKKTKWPKLIWATAHAPGLLKSSSFTGQIYDQVKVFNKIMVGYLRKINIPIFDTFNMTSETVSFDGTHYGLGVQIAKTQLYLNYLSELREHGEW